MSDKQANRGIICVEAIHLPNDKSSPQRLQCEVVEEDALTLDVEGVGHYTLMWTPSEIGTTAQGFTIEDGLLGEGEEPEGLALAMGFALTEGLITSRDDIKSVSVCADNTKVVQLQLHNPEQVQATRRNVVINSSCSICGPTEILQDNVLGLSKVGMGLKLARSDFSRVMQHMTDKQRIFHRTGGSHAAAIFDNQGNVLAVAEDLGRHNALDKVIGMVLLERGSLSDCGAVLSSRLSVEMVIKAVRADLQMMLAVSAPTSLAIDVAEKFGVTLCGFVREQRATIYAHPDRITDTL